MNEARLYDIIRYPVISEKSNRIAEKNQQFAFIVKRDAGKDEIKKAIEKIFKVRVISVQTVNMKGKQKRFGRILGKQKDYKKAYIRLHKEDDINFSDNIS